MVQTTAIAISQDWFDSPIVSNAMKRLQAEDRLTGLDLLETVSRDLAELEERFPGIPFSDIYSAPRANLTSVRRAMHDAGVAAADVELVCGAPRNPHARHGAPEYTTPKVFEMLRRGLTVPELAAELGITEGQAAWPHSFKLPPSEREQKVLDCLFDNPDWSIRLAAKHTGVSRPTAQRATCKRAYRYWLAENYPEEVVSA